MPYVSGGGNTVRYELPKCPICKSEIKGWESTSVIQYFYITAGNMIDKLHNERYHKDCFNKNFIYREEDPHNCTCLCGEKLGHSAQVLQVDGNLAYHINCFNKYWMPYYKFKEEKDILKKEINNYQRWSTRNRVNIRWR